MKFLFDLFPILVFFGVFKWSESHINSAYQLITYLFNIISVETIQISQASILLATTVVILVTLMQITYLIVRGKKIDGALWVSLPIIMTFGGATIYFRDETFIKWKPTILYWCFAVILIFSKYFLKKNLIYIMMKKKITLPIIVWTKLNQVWSVFFFLLGLLNLYIAFNYTLNTWVNFKMFGTITLMFIFIILQSLFISKYTKI